MERQPGSTLSVSVFSFTPGLQQAAPTWTVGADVAAAPPVGHPHPLHDGRLHRRVGAATQAGQLTPARATLDQSEVSIVSRDSTLLQPQLTWARLRCQEPATASLL